MPLELLEFRVFRQSTFLIESYEIDGPQVPQDQTWRVSHLAVALFTFQGNVQGNAPAVVGIYDTAQPGATAVPCQVTQLSPLAINGEIGGTTLPGGSAAVQNSYYDVDDDPEITLLPGYQLAVLFYEPNLAAPGPLGAVRAEFAVYEGVPGQPQPFAGAQPAPMIPPGV